MTSRKPYAGTVRKLVLGIDIGTTYSGVSYSILNPGRVPEIRQITRFPAQDRAGADSKIPSIMYYDSNGVPKAFGAEALDAGIISRAIDEEWTKVEWFKLFLAKSASVHQKLRPLPFGKNPTIVFADFLSYLFRCAEKYIRETHHNGDAIWEGVQSGHVHFIVAHPNAWEGLQQSKLRDAAVMAGLISRGRIDQSRLQFVTEGEASLHFCLQQGLGPHISQTGKGILIIDAGGGTIDISAYTSTKFSKKYGFEEIATPHCQFNGSVFVSIEARRVLSAKLQASKFAGDLDEIIHQFDSSTKLTFRNPEEPSFIRFGRVNDNEPAYGIRNGQMRLDGTEVASFFEPSIQSIIEAVTSITFSFANPISCALLVGGFAASDHLFDCLKAHFGPLGIHIFRPDAHVNKAVSDGAVGFHVDHQVSVRVARSTYGVELQKSFDPHCPSHLKRKSKTYIDLDGERTVPGGFSTILCKGTKISETEEFRTPGYHILEEIDKSIDTTILQYVGIAKTVEWLDDDKNKFIPLCSISMDLETVRLIARAEIRPSTLYWRVDYEILLSFGLTELKAQFVWKENGVEKRSPAILVYPDNKPSVVYSKFDGDE